jgi:hypothetical protein
MSKRKCGLCGKDPAAGFASANGVFFCHGDEDEEPTCYMRSQSFTSITLNKPIKVGPDDELYVTLTYRGARPWCDPPQLIWAEE